MRATCAAAAADPALQRCGRVLYWAAAGAVLLLLSVLAFFPVQSDDIFMYLAIGRRIVRERAFPAIDPFLFSIPDYHWHILHEWASHLIAYGLYCLGGWTLLIASKVLLLQATAGTALATAWRLGVRGAIVPLLLGLAAVAGYHRFIERSSLVSDFLTAAVLAIVSLERASPGRLRYLLPLIFLAWANLHPGFYTGLAICGLAVLWDLRRIRQRPTQVFAACVLASALACLINPEGVVAVTYPLRPLFDRAWDLYRLHNAEWRSTLTQPYLGSVHVPAFITLATLCSVLALSALRRRPWFELSVLVLLIWLGLSAARFVLTASFALSVLGAILAGKSWFREAAVRLRGLRWLDLAVSAGVTVAAAVPAIVVALRGYDTLVGPRHLGSGIDAGHHPVQAVDFIERIDPRSNLFSRQSFGGYLAWRWDGERKLFYHGFVDDMAFYARDFSAVYESPEEFARVVEQYRIGAFLLQRIERDAPAPEFVYRLYDSPEWWLVYKDQAAMLFVRDIPENQAALARCAQLNARPGRH